MAITSQVGRQPVSGADRSMKNYGVTDIPAGKAVMWDTTSGNLNGIIVPATSASTAATCGITIETIKAGFPGRVAILGTAVATANATLAAGDTVDVDTTSTNEGKVKAHASGVKSLGTACHAAVAGDQLEVLVSVCPNA